MAVLAATPPRSQASSIVTSDSRVEGDARGRALANLEAAAPAEYAAWVDADGDAKTRAFADLHWAAPAESMALLRADGTVLGSVRGRVMLDLFEAAPAEYVAWIRGLRTEDDSGLRAQADLIEVATAEFVAFQRSSSDPGPALGNLVEAAPAEFVAWIRADSDAGRHALADLIETAPTEHVAYIRARSDVGRANAIEIAVGDLIEAASIEYVAWLRADNDAEVRALVDLEVAAPTEYEAWVRASQATKDPDFGLSRSKPYPFGGVAALDDWKLKVLQVIRGEEAWKLIREAHPSSDPPSDTREYVLVELTATYTGDSQVDISQLDFGITGSSGILWGYISFIPRTPNPAFEATLLRGGSTRGWLSFEIIEAESDLILVFSKGNQLVQTISFGFYFTGIIEGPIGDLLIEEPRYLALDSDAVVVLDVGDQPKATDLGKSPEVPVPVGARATTRYFEVDIVEIIRGDEAWNMLRGARESNNPPGSGMEYLLARIRVKNITSHLSVIGDDAFRVVGDQRVVWENPVVSEPEPAIGAVLYPGAIHDGWVALQAAVGEENLVIVFEHTVGLFDTDRRYLAVP